MFSTQRFGCVLAGLAASLGLVGDVGADIIPVSRLSEITFNGVNLGTGGEPGPDAAKSATDLTAAFAEDLSGSVSVVVIGGATNTGDWFISQSTTIHPGVVTSDVSQSATTATDFDSPGIFTSSRFLFDFQVDSVTQILLEGSIVGSSDPANDLFARVQLLQGAGSLFNTSFPSGTFPFVTTLQPNTLYTLTVEARGETIFNNTTSSSASVRLSIVPEPPALALVALGLAGLLARRVALVL